MNRTRKIALAVMVLIAGGLAYWYFDDGPRYGGKSYAYWMAQYYRNHNYQYNYTRAEIARMMAAWHGTGKDGVRYLTKLMVASESDRAFARVESEVRNAEYGPLWRRAGDDLLNLASNVKPYERRQLITHDSLCDAVAHLLIELRVTADEVSPAFTPLINNTNNLYSRSRNWALYVLAASKGVEKVEPLLLRQIAESYDGSTIVAGALEGLYQGTPWSPEMLTAISRVVAANPNYEYTISMFAQRSRPPEGTFTTNQISALVRLMKTQAKDNMRFFWASFIVLIDPTQEEAVSELRRCLLDPNYGWMALQFMEIRGVQVPVNSLIAFFKNSRSIASVTSNLYSLFPNGEWTLPQSMNRNNGELRQALHSSDKLDGIIAAGFLLQLTPNDSEAVSVLLDAVKQTADPPLASQALFFINELGPSVSGALPALTNLLQNARPELKDSIQNVLTNRIIVHEQ
jgi:hypothetical protein